MTTTDNDHRIGDTLRLHGSLGLHLVACASAIIPDDVSLEKRRTATGRSAWIPIMTDLGLSEGQRASLAPKISELGRLGRPAADGENAAAQSHPIVPRRSRRT